MDLECGNSPTIGLGHHWQLVRHTSYALALAASALARILIIGNATLVKFTVGTNCALDLLFFVHCAPVPG